MQKLLTPLVLSTCLLSAAISPPHDWLFLHPVVWVPALWFFHRLPPRRAFFLGWLGGTGMMLALFYWLPATVVEFTEWPHSVGVIVYGIYAVVFGGFLGVFAGASERIRRICGSWWPVGIAAWFTACELLDPQIIPFYQGSPWSKLPSLFLVATLTGVASVSFLVILCNAVVLQGLESLRRGEAHSSRRAFLRNAALLAGLLALAFAASAQRLDAIAKAEAAAPTLRVALVQSALYGEEQRALEERSGLGARADALVRLSRAALERSGPIDVLVWPETSLKGPPEAPHNAAAIELARQSGVEIWTGARVYARTRDGQRNRFNSAYRIDGEGRVHRRYDKNVLVPFAERMPLVDLVPALGRIEGVRNDLPGRRPVLHDTETARFGFLICYEAILPRTVRRVVSERVDLLVNVTYDGWFGRTTAPHQHLMLAAAQSALAGVPMLRAATTGISTFIDARGVIGARSAMFQPEVLVEDVKIVSVPSPWVRYGEWFGWTCVAACAALLLVDARRQRLLRAGT